jgi:2-dehydropantoate 2-reductase
VSSRDARYPAAAVVGSMKILIFGAGVIGTLYAALFRTGGHHVTVLARGDRLASIRSQGLIIEDVNTKIKVQVIVDTVERLERDDAYDFALIAIRRDQLASVMPELIDNRQIPTLLFMLNNPAGTTELTKVLGQRRVMLGFPGAGGARDGEVISYAMIAQQPTMLGEVSGQKTPQLKTILEAFKQSGIKCRTSNDMDAWLKCHAFFVTAICGAIYRAGSNCLQLSNDRANLRLLVNGVWEGFTAVQALGRPVTPFALRALFMWLPSTFAIQYWQRFFATEMADIVFGRHARAASAEMLALANDCRSLLQASEVPAPALQQLYEAIEVYGFRHQAINSSSRIC